MTTATPTAYPLNGDRLDVSVTSGYCLTQERPFACRPACTCGQCDGQTVVHDGTVERVIYWADNSVEAEVRCDDGRLRRRVLTAPHGDPC